MRILVVEDDIVIASELERALRYQDYQADVARDGKTALQLAAEKGYGVIVLDVMIPAPNGIEVCRQLRAAGDPTPILMLTARDAIENRVEGLDSGADDYLVKPFDFKELLARIRALHRRESQQKAAIITVGNLTIDPHRHSVERAGQIIHLTKREFSLLDALARHTGHVLTREAILDRVWNNMESQPNTVNFHMSSLRRKIDLPGEAPLIHTVHGVGYVMRPPGDPA